MTLKTPDKIAEAFSRRAGARLPSSKKEAKEKAKKETTGERAPPAQVLAYYDSMKKAYWSCNHSGEWQEYNVSTLTLLLRKRGWSSNVYTNDGLSLAEDMVLRIAHENSVHYAGPISGFQPGIYEVSGSRVLVTRGPQMIEPAKGDFPLLRAFFDQLLGDQWPHFYGWVKWALQSLRAGHPWNPGQMLAIAGPPGCGKSLCQQLITQMLGGRSAKPYLYMIGETTFNADLFSAEHLVIEDEAASTDIRTRRQFGHRLKTLCVNKEQSFHDKGKRALTLQPFVRLSITLNDEPEALMVLPPLDNDLRDKIILLKASPVAFPFPSKEFPDSQTYWRALMDELPFFMGRMQSWRIPDKLRDQRFGIKAYLNPDLVWEVDALSPELKLWQLIEQSGIVSDATPYWEGSASDLETTLRTGTHREEATRLLSFNTACGTYLGRLKMKRPRQVMSERQKGNLQKWMIFQQEQ